MRDQPGKRVVVAMFEGRSDADAVKIKKSTMITWLKQLRVHQYAKNALIFLPLLTAQKFTAVAVNQALLAAIAFSLCASAVYIVNDWVDLESDRQHPLKRNRPMAAGLVRPVDALVVAGAFLMVAILVALYVSLDFAKWLVGYLALTTAYTFWLKRKMMVDVVVLAALYTLRVVSGAVAISVPVSEWLLAFSMFIFAALALIKRYTELAMRQDAGSGAPQNRNYLLTDMPVVQALAAASGLNAVTVFSLYISSDYVRKLYTHPQYLWLICPLLIYWMGRILILAHRRLLPDDPIVFALKDNVSLAVLALTVAIVLSAI